MEERVSGKNRPASVIFQKPANAVLSMTRCINRFHCYIPNFEHLAIPRRQRDTRAVLPTDYWFDIECGGLLAVVLALIAEIHECYSYNLGIPPCMISVAGESQ